MGERVRLIRKLEKYMSKVEADLSKKDKKNRDFILTGNMWSVVMHLCIPLA